MYVYFVMTVKYDTVRRSLWCSVCKNNLSNVFSKYAQIKFNLDEEVCIYGDSAVIK